MTDEVTLSVGGKAHRGWESVRITRSIEQLSHTFNLGYASRATADGKRLPVKEGDACLIKIDDEVFINGYIDEADDGYDTGSVSANASGSNLADLIECSAIFKAGQWKGAQLLDIAADLCAPFDVSVVLDVDAGAASGRFALQEGESVFEALARLAKMRSLVLTTSGDRDVILTRAGSRVSATTLAYGANIISGRLKGSWRDRFSEYIVKTQAAGDDSFFGGQASMKKTSTDNQVNRRRPLIIMAENEDSGKELQARADWERNSRAGRSRRYTCTVKGWRDDAGDLWKPNTLVKIDDTQLEFKDELLIVSTALTRSENEGSTTQLELTRAETFDVQPLPPPKPKRQQLFDFAAEEPV